MRLEQANLSFFNTKSGLLQANIWSELDSGCWKTAQFKIHETNTLNGVLNRANMVSLLPDFVPLEAGQRWNHLEKRIEEKLLQPKLLKSGLEDFLCKSKAFFEKFHNKHIAVQLSGGVDSSLIIGLLRFFGIKHSLIGYYNRRYEFRTESYIQNILADDCGDAILINYEDHLPYSGLLNAPPHQYPDMTCCGLSANQAMASACHDAGIEILLTGCGGDLALGEKIDNEKCMWIPAIFNYSWFQDVVYTPNKVTLVSFFSDTDILECLWNLRMGQKFDPKKIWARNFFQSFLPRELVEYTYKADFWGLYIDGLVNSLPEIRFIHKRAYEFSENSYFEDAKLHRMLQSDLYNCDQQLYQRLEARISSAVWINSLASHPCPGTRHSRRDGGSPAPRPVVGTQEACGFAQVGEFVGMILSKTTPFILLLCLMLGGCASVSVSRQEWSNKVCVPDRILVRPFTVDRTKFRVDRDGAELDAFEKKFSAEFADRLAERLSKHVRPAKVVATNEKVKDSKAWLIEGHFTKVNQGSRALRSLVGFGLGATKTEAQVDVFQVGAKGRLTRIARLETTGGSNAEPGALFASPFGAVPRLITNVTTSGLAADARRTARTITAAVSEKLSAQNAELAGRPLRAKRLGSLPSESDQSTR